MPSSKPTRAVIDACRSLVATRFRRRVLVRLALVFLLFPLLLQCLIAYYVGADARILPPELLQARKLLLVTAHPDDECLFFSPTILGILNRNSDVRGGLLVLSTGNNYGIGEQRKEELKGSCEALGIDSTRCEALDHPDLQDNPKVWWKSKTIQPILEDYVRKWNIDAIITFDKGGVSGHINHRAVSAAVEQYALKNEKAPHSYMLVTTALPRKYTILFDLPYTALSFTWRIAAAIISPSHASDGPPGMKALVANTWHRYLRTRKAFASHGSQYTWDRNLYMILSRYVWFNDLVRVPHRSAKV